MTVTITTNFDMFDDGKKHRIQQNSVVKSTVNTEISTNNVGQSDDESFSFWDMLDVVNPMQHLPVIGNIYREITGDTIQPVARIAGGAIFGGIVGVASSLVNVIVQETSGKDIGEHMMAMVIDETKTTNIPTGPDLPDTSEAQQIKIIKQGHKTTDNDMSFENPYAVLAQAKTINSNDTTDRPVIDIRGRHYVDHDGNRISTSTPSNFSPITDKGAISADTHLALMMIQNLENADRTQILERI